MQLQILPLEKLKPKISDETKLTFGKQFTDRMFIMDYVTGQGWHNARIQPYQPFVMDDNVQRFNRSARRMCMPEVDAHFLLNALKDLVRLEAEWVPRAEGTSLYIRPTMIATEPMLGVRPADQYVCYIILCPVGAY